MTKLLGYTISKKFNTTAASKEYITPSMFHVMYFILAILVIWCVFKLIEKLQSSSDPKDDYVHLPEKMVYISDPTPLEVLKARDFFIIETIPCRRNNNQVILASGIH